MNNTMLDRRQFLNSSLIATTLAASGRLPLLAARRRNTSAIDANSGPHPVKPIREYINRFTPSQAPSPDQQNYTLTYDIIHWSGANASVALAPNPSIGKVTISRGMRDGGSRYKIRQNTRIGGADNVIQARIICNNDNLGSVIRWHIKHHYTAPNSSTPAPQSHLNETGACKNGRIEIDNGNYSLDFTAKNPVATQWTILDFLYRKANPRLDATFDLLQDLSLFKPDQRLFYDGPTRVNLADNNTVTLQTYAQIGRGILPIHYLLDDQQRPQLITSSLVSWALSS